MVNVKRLVSITQKLVDELREIDAEEKHGGALSGSVGPIIPNCLVVEDDDSDAELTTRALHAMGAEVIRAKTSEEAISLLRKSKTPEQPDFNMVFLDLNLVGSNQSGYHVLKFIRERFPKLHVVIVSGYIDEGLINYIARDPGGYIGIIKKPLEKMDVKEIFLKHRMDGGGPDSPMI